MLKFKSLKSKSGQGLVEYILIIALIAIVAIVAVRMFGSKVKKGYEDTGNTIEKEVSTANKSAQTGQ